MKTPTPPEEVRKQVGDFDQANILYLVEPQSAPEDLLGRAVLVQDHHTTIADTRASGCEVQIKNNTGGEFTRSYLADLDTLTSLSGGYVKLLQLEAAYGRGVTAELQITNTQSLSANVAGPCGEFVITEVKIGYGSRKLLRKARGGVGSEVGVQNLGLQAGHSANSQIEQAIEWSKPQAYAVSYSQVKQVDRVKLKVEAPQKVYHDERVDIKITADRNAYMIVYFIEEDMSAMVLVPSQAFPEPRLFAGETRILELTASLHQKNQPARETLVIYALSQEADYQQFRPQEAQREKQGLEYAAELTQKLSELPLERWTRITVDYEITPHLEE